MKPSCRFRGFYWANYSTGLGSSLHELGHTFDLAHSSTGIMARGFDDLYRVFTVRPQSSRAGSSSRDSSRRSSPSPYSSRPRSRVRITPLGTTPRFDSVKRGESSSSFAIPSGVMNSHPCRTSYQSSPSRGIPCVPRYSFHAFRHQFCDVTAV